MPTTIRQMHRMQPKLPAAPMLARIPEDRQGAMVALAAAGDMSRQSRLNQVITVARRVGHLTIWGADLVAVEVLKTHPALVWGDDYWTCDGPIDEYVEEVEAEWAGVA